MKKKVSSSQNKDCHWMHSEACVESFPRPSHAYASSLLFATTPKLTSVHTKLYPSPYLAGPAAVRAPFFHPKFVHSPAFTARTLRLPPLNLSYYESSRITPSTCTATHFSSHHITRLTYQHRCMPTHLWLHFLARTHPSHLA